MIGYITVGTNNLERAAEFYDQLFALIGAKRLLENERLIAWGVSADAPMFVAAKPWDGKPATAGNGTMIALAVDSKEKVHAMYDKAIELGGTDEGPPGPRLEPFYIGYFRDLDGNKLNFFCISQGE